MYLIAVKIGTYFITSNCMNIVLLCETNLQIIMNLSINKLLKLTKLNFYRKYSSTYKPIKRPAANIPSTKDRNQNNNKHNDQSQEQNVSLLNLLSAKIKMTGPITVAAYMKEVLTNPVKGYYTTKGDVFGRQGDFITSPDIGQIFGELIAVWLYTEWQKLGSPKPLQLVELGPGRATLLKDILRVLTKLGLTKKDISFHLVEVSPTLTKLQAQQLCYQSADVLSDDTNNGPHHSGETATGIQIHWYQHIQNVPKEFSIFLAHEFFDALPIHKFQKIDDKWREILVDIDRDKDGALRYVSSRGDTAMLQLFLKTLDKDDKRDHIEYSFERRIILEDLSLRIEEYGGICLIMDYGHVGDKTDTFRAFKNHKLHDPLIEPGSADLTADVDFKQIKEIVEDKLITFGPVEQREFLQKLGGDIRLEELIKNSGSKLQVDDLKSSYDMLTNPQQMGSRFKFFTMFPAVVKEHLQKFPVNGFY